MNVSLNIYTVTVTETATGCTGTPVTLNLSSNLTVVATLTQPTCDKIMVVSASVLAQVDILILGQAV
ncbi:MAG: hypothetical protein R2774_05920 [Saprospiraceae bacterium]